LFISKIVLSLSGIKLLNKMITRQDVLEIAVMIGVDPTEIEIDEVLSQYPTAQDDDLSVTWDLVVENLLWSVVSESDGRVEL